eukprot:COSAG06_NODE_1980_length_7926_cov_10.286061_2_plen_561_part_00
MVEGGLTAATVAECLRADGTRVDTLHALEAMHAPIPIQLAISAAPGLVDVAATTGDRDAFRRCTLLVARLMAEATSDELAPVYGAAFGGERLAAYCAPRLIVEATRRVLTKIGDTQQGGQGGQLLTSADAYNHACHGAVWAPATVRGWEVLEPAAMSGRAMTEYQRFCDTVLRGDSVFSKNHMPSDDVPRQLLNLLVQLLRSHELPELAIGGAWKQLELCFIGRPRLGPVAVELGLIDLATEHLRALGSPAYVLSISHANARHENSALFTTYGLTKLYAGQHARPDLDACVSSGIFDICSEAVRMFALAGEDGLRDTSSGALGIALEIIGRCSGQPSCEPKVYDLATPLAYCLEHSLNYAPEAGRTTGAMAAAIVCKVFGRDEDASFTFTPRHIEVLTTHWTQIVRAVGLRVAVNPCADNIFAAQLCVSDVHKPLLISNENFVPYLVDALLLDPGHPRAQMEEEAKAWCQQHHTEAIAQLAVHDGSREALLHNGSVVPALQTVTKSGLSEQARELASAALLALSEKKLEMATGGQKHVMLSCKLSSPAVMWLVPTASVHH